MVDHSAYLNDPKVKAAQEKVQAAKIALDEAQKGFGAAIKEYRAAQPLLERLVFAADSRCGICNSGMAYDPAGLVGGDASAPFRRPNQWDCSAFLLGGAPPTGNHDKLSFMEWEVLAEYQPSAGGRTTRPTT